MRRCFFLGAGASAAFGFPVTAALLPLIRKRLREGNLFNFARSPELRDQLRNQLSVLLKTLFPGFENLSDDDLPSVVDVLSLIDHSLRTGTTPARLVPISALTEFRTLLEVAICDAIQPQTRIISNSATTFWQWLERENSRHKDSVAIISTNYDTSIDQLLSQHLTFEQIASDVDFGMNWRDIDRELPYARPAEPGLRFYKLHGSLNWLRCDMCEHVYLNNYAFSIYVRVLDPDLTGINSCHCGHGKLSLVLVTPSYVRDVREPNLVGIWRNAVELLRTSDEWIFVGYSLPPDDINIRSMLIRAVQGCHQAPTVKLVLDRHRPDILARYRLLFPGTEALSDGFAAYINHLEHDKLPNVMDSKEHNSGN